MAKRLLLVRHAQIDAGGRLVGATDLPLDDTGRRQARKLAARLRRFAPGAWFCSPMQRCVETARAAAATPTTIDPALREIHFGRWENRTFAEAAADSPEIMDRWAAFDPEFAFPEGESVREFIDRVQRAAERLTSDPADVVVAMTHGGVIRTMLCGLLGIAPQHYAAFAIPYAGIAVLDLLDGMGVLSHLLPPDVPERPHG